MQNKWSVTGLAFGLVAGMHAASAATFETFVDDQPGFLAAIGTGTVSTLETFASAVDMKTIGAAGVPDAWNGFTVEAYGPNSGTSWSPSKYCQKLNYASNPPTDLDSCIYWNPMVPAVPGIYAAVNLDNGISFKPVNLATAAFSFDFVDWNDGSLRSDLLILASDGSSTVVSGPINPSGAPPQNFGVTLSPADIAAGLYIQEMRWIGIAPEGEVVGFYNIQTYTNPAIPNTPPVANPDSYPMPTQPVGMDLLANDSDADSDPLRVSAINGTPITYGTAQTISVPGGSVDVSSAGVITFTPSGNVPGPVTFPYEISDGRGGTSASTVTFTPVVVPPVAATPVPSLNHWGVLGLTSLLAMFGFALTRRRKQ